MIITNFLRGMVLLSAGLLLACQNNTHPLFGQYRDRTTVGHNITPTQWSLTYPGKGTCDRTLINFHSTDGYAIFSESGGGCFNAGTYGRLYFTYDANNALWYCNFLTGLPTLSNAQTLSTSPDASSPASGGCNGAAWTKLNAADSNFALAGNFSDTYSSTQQYTNSLWTAPGYPSGICTYAIIFYDNTNGFFLYQQQADAGCYAANNYKFGKVFWMVDSNAKLYYCEQLYGKSSYLTVANDSTTPTYNAATGCAGFSWTQLTPQ